MPHGDLFRRLTVGSAERIDLLAGADELFESFQVPHLQQARAKRDQQQQQHENPEILGPEALGVERHEHENTSWAAHNLTATGKRRDVQGIRLGHKRRMKAGTPPVLSAGAFLDLPF